MEKWTPGILPLVEGKCPPITRLGINGQIESCYPEPDPDYEDPEIRETKKYRITDKEELYNYMTVCKKCGTEFIAYFATKLVRNYCPCCGEPLEGEE